MDGTLYTGITTDLDRRILEHNGVLPGGARYTSGRKPVELAYWSAFDDRSQASKEEYRIKQLKTVEKFDLIKNHENKLK